MLSNYEKANLIPLLETIRKPGRYAGLCGVNALTNAAGDGIYNKDEVIRELRRAVIAGEAGDHTFTPIFTNPDQGLAYGLNPYTDWSLAQLAHRPSHFYLFLGLDWYSISGLVHSDSWFDYLGNPFLLAPEDRYWHNVWAWILRKMKTGVTGTSSWQTPILEREASAFIRADGGAFVFHNRIPYLRPAGQPSAGNKWYEAEWKKERVRRDATEDLRILREQAKNRIVAFCTGRDSEKTLVSAGYDPHKVFSWKAHPSQVFHPSRFVKENFWFRGPDYFQERP
jgi:hypothetical protein